MKLVLVGEQPGSGPTNEGPLGGECARRLAAHLGVPTRVVLAQHRTNLLPEPGPWDTRAARVAAVELNDAATGLPFVLLGRRVANAFGLRDVRPFVWVKLGTRSYLLLPHPSGRCRSWNDPLVRAQAQRTLGLILSR